MSDMSMGNMVGPVLVEWPSLPPAMRWVETSKIAESEPLDGFRACDAVSLTGTPTSPCGPTRPQPTSTVPTRADAPSILRHSPGSTETGPSAAPAPPSPTKGMSVPDFCTAAWAAHSIRGTGGKVFGEQAEARRHVFGEARLNRPYPDPDLAAAGIPQDLPMTVTTPFKWLMHPPIPLGDGVLLHAQHEGGPGFCDDEELECRDLFIMLRRDEATGRFVECGHLQTRPSEYAWVYRSTDSAKPVPGSDHHFLVPIEEGTYASGIIGRHTHLYQVDAQGIRETGCWPGVLPVDAEPVQRAVAQQV